MKTVIYSLILLSLAACSSVVPSKGASWNAMEYGTAGVYEQPTLIQMAR